MNEVSQEGEAGAGQPGFGFNLQANWNALGNFRLSQGILYFWSAKFHFATMWSVYSGAGSRSRKRRNTWERQMGRIPLGWRG